MSGMADNDEDTFFDDDFPDIPDDELRQLEQNAITFTQQEQNSLKPQIQAPHLAPSPSRHVKINTPPPRRQLPVPTNVPHHFLHQQTKTSLPNASTDTLDNAFSFLDEDGLPVVVEEPLRVVPPKQQDETSAREQWRLDRFAQPNPQTAQKARQSYRSPTISFQPQSFQSQAYSGAVHPVAQEKQNVASFVPALFEDEDLRNKIEELQANLSRANEEINTRRGEVANVRNKQAEAHKLHQKELNALHKVKQEETNKHKAAIEALSTEKDKIISEIQFLKAELDGESRKVQTLQRQLKERPLKEKPGNINTTPKRNANSLRDGFDDEDLMVISPVKSGRRSKPGTPTANRKRKQPTGNDLNVQPLVLRPSGSSLDAKTEPELEPGTTKPSTTVQLVRKDRETERHLRLIQQVLTFRPPGSQEVLVERLMRFSFPSEPSRTLGSILMVAAATISGKRLPGDLLQVFIDLWTRALQERYHVCINLLIDVINHVLENDMFVIDGDIITKLLPLAQSTATINASVRFRLLAKKDWLDDPDRKKPQFDANIDTTACLDLLYTLACLVSDETDGIELFWRSMDTDFVLMMLNACQPIADVTLTLQLLATSILPTKFGNICPPDQQPRMETYIIDRVFFLLWEQPKTLDSESSYPRPAICHLRFEALKLIARLTIGSCPNPLSPSLARNHGTNFLATHVTAIARLVRSIYDEVDSMYLLSPTQSLHARHVNTAVQILHFILSSPAGREVDLQRSLAGINGGAHKYCVVLTRLAFSEGVSIDRGITEETVRMATELLEDVVTPDEAEDLTAAFGGGTGRSGAARSTQG